MMQLPFEQEQRHRSPSAAYPLSQAEQKALGGAAALMLGGKSREDQPRGQRRHPSLAL
jgi:hypothetical protein